MIGIGGIGMSALAQLYLSKGAYVQGSDRAESPVTELLTTKGIPISIGHDAAHVSTMTSFVVYSDAVSHDNPERIRARELGLRELSYFEALGEATIEGTSIVVSGTHGKTTTTAMLAQILIDAGKEPTVIAGSILSEYGSNFVPGRPDLFVIEGCEYKRHFLHLHPNILIINNIELDHTDYYHDLDDMQDAFKSAIALVPEGGTLVTNTDSETIVPVLDGVEVPIVSYQTTNIPELRAKGSFNRSNAQAAKTAALAFDPLIDLSQIDASLASFKGTWRRFEYKGITPHGALVYDDYAHHPTAVRGTLEMLRAEFPGKRIVVIFHPHLYSRTKSFFHEFASALSIADKVFLHPIYAAREAFDPTVSSELLAEEVVACGGNAQLVPDFDVAATLLADVGDDTVIVTMGAGDVYKLAERLVQELGIRN